MVCVLRVTTWVHGVYSKGHYLGYMVEGSLPKRHGEYLKGHYLGIWCVFEGSLPGYTVCI